MIRINLLPFKAVEKEYIKEQVLIYFLSLVFLFGILGYMYYSTSNRISQLKERVSSLKDESDKYKGIKADLARLKEQSASLDHRMSVIESLQVGRIGPVHVMDELSTNLPEKRLWLDSLSLKTQGTVLTLDGVALDNETIADFMRSLESSPYFQDVDLITSELKIVENVRLKHFTIKSGVTIPEM
jgi:type IV pilus assembly protein PilN